MTRPRIRGFLLILAVTFGLPSLAATHRYTLDIPTKQRIAFQLDLPVQHPGVIAVRAEWSGPRILSFKLDGPPGNPVRLRRSGPSPQTLSVRVEPSATETWKLSILGLPASGAGEGLLTVELPDHPEVVARREEELNPPEPTEPEPEPWMVEVAAPAGAPPDRVDLVEAAEDYRGRVVTEDWEMGPDACQWQEDLLRYLVTWRDRSLEGLELPELATRRYFARFAEVVTGVEDLRTSDDPRLAGPPPESSRELQAWMRERRGVILPLEKDLDNLLDMLHDGFAPELEGEAWPPRLVSCLMACERNFEERGRLGEERASNRDLAEAQWETIVSASRALNAIAHLSAAPPPAE